MTAGKGTARQLRYGKSILVKLEKEMHDQMKCIASQRSISVNKMIRDAISKELDESDKTIPQDMGHLISQSNCSNFSQ